jgi:ubiquinone/menaquinone biosynthesis C-methylase UbiE
LRAVSLFRGRDIAAQLNSLLPPDCYVLDLGCGTGGVSKALAEKGHSVISADLNNYLVFPEIELIRLTGGQLPFNKKQFDACVLHMVLHHTDSQYELLSEAQRVAKRIIVGEEVVNGPAGHFLLSVYDSIANFTITGEAHSNRSEAEWLDIFSRLGFATISIVRKRVFVFIKQSIFVLE